MIKSYTLQFMVLTNVFRNEIILYGIPFNTFRSGLPQEVRPLVRRQNKFKRELFRLLLKVKQSALRGANVHVALSAISHQRANLHEINVRSSYHCRKTLKKILSQTNKPHDGKVLINSITYYIYLTDETMYKSSNYPVIHRTILLLSCII